MLAKYVLTKQESWALFLVWMQDSGLMVKAERLSQKHTATPGYSDFKDKRKEGNN